MERATVTEIDARALRRKASEITPGADPFVPRTDEHERHHGRAGWIPVSERGIGSLPTGKSRWAGSEYAGRNMV